MNVVHEEISKTLNNTKETTDSRRIKFEKNLVFEDISFKYDNTENYILEHVNLDIKKFIIEYTGKVVLEKAHLLMSWLVY